MYDEYPTRDRNEGWTNMNHFFLRTLVAIIVTGMTTLWSCMLLHVIGIIFHTYFLYISQKASCSAHMSVDAWLCSCWVFTRTISCQAHILTTSHFKNYIPRIYTYYTYTYLKTTEWRSIEGNTLTYKLTNFITSSYPINTPTSGQWKNNISLSSFIIFFWI